MKQILIAEGVPLANKGEEAILRGIQDMLYPQEDVQLGILDYVSEPIVQDNITVFPYEWLYPYARPLRSRPLNLPPLTLQQNLAKFASILSMPLGNLGASKILLQKDVGEKDVLIKFARNADLILLGHDGAFCLDSCPVILAAKKLGKRVGILGSGTGNPRGYWSAPVARWMYAKAVQASDFAYFREQTTYEFMRELCGNMSKVCLAPDPAFAMQPASVSDVESVLQGEKWYKECKEQSRPLVFATVCENSVVFLKSFCEAQNEDAKRQLHSSRLARIIDGLVDAGATVVFLPHSIDQGRGNDLAVAADVIKSTSAKEHVFIWDADLGARMLKGAIRAADFVVGERTHSLIGAVSVRTPFAALTNKHDRRTHDIIGLMCECDQCILDLDIQDEMQLANRVVELFRQRAVAREKLTAISERLRRELTCVAATVLQKETLK